MRQYRAIPIGGKDFVYGWYCRTQEHSYTDGGHPKRHFIIQDNAEYMLDRTEPNVFDITEAIAVIPETVGQQVGLKDKKRTKEFPEGQEIYKGDIVEFNVVVPIWDEEKHIVKEHRPETWRKVVEYKAPKFWVHWYPKKLEIIGNKWEHPNLLENIK